MREGIAAALATIEAEHAVRILFATEAGSRAWGFASPDSDYDVRFVYAHGLDWYLRVFPGQDHITCMLPGDLDLAGWDVKKALGLFAQSNAVLFEQLGSDIVYRDDGDALQRLRALVPAFFNPLAACNHYLGLARRMHANHLGSAHVNLKKLFYVLRPLAACRWVQLHTSMPPTSFDAVLAGIDLGADQRAWIDALRAQKIAASESGEAPLVPAIRAWIADWLEQSNVATRNLPNRRGEVALLDQVATGILRS